MEKLTKKEREHIVESCLDILGCNLDGALEINVSNFNTFKVEQFSTLNSNDVRMLRSIVKKLKE